MKYMLMLFEPDTDWEAAPPAELKAALDGCRVALRGGAHRAPRRTAPGRAGRYLLQAAISAVHAEAASVETTDWRQIVALYDTLIAVQPSPVAALGRAVAIGMADGPAEGLRAIDQLAGDPRLAGYHRLPAARAELPRRLGDHKTAAEAYRQAAQLAGNDVERAYLADRAAASEGRPGG